MAQHIGTECIFVEKLIGHGSERNKETGQHGPVFRFQIGGAFKHAVEERMHQLPLERLNGYITLALTHLIELRLRTLQAPRDGRSVHLAHRLENNERLGTSS